MSEQTRIIDGDHGPRLIIEEGYDDAGVWHTREIDLIHLVAMSELYGIADMGETIEAIRHQNDNPVEADDDLLDDTFTLLAHREKEREDSAQVVKEYGGHTSFQVEIASTQMAHRATHEPIDDGECVMDRCRRKVRETLGLAEPTRKADAASRVSRPVISGEFADMLAPYSDVLSELRGVMLHQLTDNSVNPLAETEPEPESMDPVTALFKKYGGTA